jgi:hypothetical protein
VTFEPIDHDDDTAPTTRRRAGRRAERRRYAILGALAEHGPTGALELCRLLRRPAGTLYPDLSALEADRRVVGEWLTGPWPRRRLYRLPTVDERAAQMLAVGAMEERLRRGLHAVTDQIRPEDR